MWLRLSSMIYLTQFSNSGITDIHYHAYLLYLYLVIPRMDSRAPNTRQAFYP